MKEKKKKIIVLIWVVLSLDIIIFIFKNNLFELKSLIFIMGLIIVGLCYSIIMKNRKYKNLYKSLKVYKRKFNMAIEALDGAIWEWNSNNEEFYISPKIKDILMVETEISTFSKLYSFVIEEERTDLKMFIDGIVEEKISDSFILENTIINGIGQKRTIEIQGKSKIRNNILYISGFITDITERKTMENINKVIENNYLSYNDEITSIPNRRYFIKEVTEYIKSNDSDKMAVIFIDLDNFKYINDTYGHDIGDKLLIEFTKLIKEIKIKDSFFSRYGGDEFVIVKYNLQGKDQIKVILDEIIKKLSKPILLEDKEVFCTLSIGVSIYPLDGKEIGVLIKSADMAMYLAKINGKNRYEFFDIAMLESLDREFKIEKGLRIAIDNNEIKMVFQPKINTNTEEVMGFEALVRWYSKELGFVSPKEFIPIAESSGIIIQLGKYIIDESFRRCKELTMLTDKNFKMAINLSDVQIRDSKIVEYIRQTLEKYHLDAKYIEFEITESLIMKFPDKNIEVLDELKSLGVTLALDDFGTGYSSLSYLRTLPIDVLKIDKSFIDGILIEKKSEYIINSVVELSHFLDLEVVAEGVENSDQLNYLKDIKCDIIQGYYYSKPIEFAKASKMISRK